MVRGELKNVELDSSRRVELEDYVDVMPLPSPHLRPSYVDTPVARFEGPDSIKWECLDPHSRDSTG